MQPYFTQKPTDINWVKRDAVIKDYRTGKEVFRQNDVEVPDFWSENATNILAQKYFRGVRGSDDREKSLKDVVHRIVNTITQWGWNDGYFEAGEVEFADELRYILINQIAAFNSPVWFNIGVKGVKQQASACYLLGVEDDMESILDWYKTEGMIFKGGSGAGTNLSKIRSSMENLSGGGISSGPVSFMRGSDASAGSIKSGGRTRRAARLIGLDIDHPDIIDFIQCKVKEERKARVLKDAGFDMDLGGIDAYSLQYQNANNSIRVSDDFMYALEKAQVDAFEYPTWELKARTDGRTIKTISAEYIWEEIAKAAWECGDPGLIFHDTVNKWNTTPSDGEIENCNPCAEFHRMTWASCNLASINVLKFLNDDGSFNWEGYRHTIEVMITAMDILVTHGDQPIPKIKEATLRYRDLGLGHTNLGALLMCMGLPYDSDDGRYIAAKLASYLTAASYQVSSLLARKLGSFPAYVKNDLLKVVEQHENAWIAIDNEDENDLRVLWAETYYFIENYGCRNALTTLEAPTGTISFLMDADTTGIEPELALIKTKKLADGGTMEIVNQSVQRALQNLGYNDYEIELALLYIKDTNGSPQEWSIIKAHHLPVFATAFGDNAIDYMGHIRMMAAIQPHIGSAISKTVNCPEDITVKEIEDLYYQAWKMGLKSIAIYRDNCKATQPLNTKENTNVDLDTSHSSVSSTDTSSVETHVGCQRKKLPRSRPSRTFRFEISQTEGYVTVSQYLDTNEVGELFIRVSRSGSALAGIMDAFAVAISIGLQYGVPLEVFIKKYVGYKFEPAGITDDGDIRIASSILDYVFRRIALDYLPLEKRLELGIESMAEKQAKLSVDEDNVHKVVSGISNGIGDPSAPFCTCGNLMQRSGSCYSCASCGNTGGCA